MLSQLACLYDLIATTGWLARVDGRLASRCTLEMAAVGAVNKVVTFDSDALAGCHNYVGHNYTGRDNIGRKYIRHHWL